MMRAGIVKEVIMKAFFIVLILLFLSPAISYAQWTTTYGGIGDEIARSIQQTTDGGYIVAGWTWSFGGVILLDLWVLKLDGSGNVTWQRTYGVPPDFNGAISVQQTTDGGYIVAGFTNPFGGGPEDLWVLKLDGTGNVTWQRTYGGIMWDSANSIQQTTDGGYIVAGGTLSFGAGDSDLWVLKLDETGNVTWQRTYGGTSYDSAASIQQTTDGGYIVAGRTNSFGAGRADLWVLKLDETGNVTWQRTYGGIMWDSANSIQQTTDGGYIAAGWTESFGAGSRDFWILKLDGTGNVTWQRTYGGTGYDSPASIQQTTDGGYIAAGWTESFGAGNDDLWVLKLDGSGNIIWQRTYGSTGSDGAASIQQTTDGGYIAAGWTESFGAGSKDFWVIKLNGSGAITGCSAMGTSSAIVNPTAVTGRSSSASVAASAVTPLTSSATVTDTSLTGTQICYALQQAPTAIPTMNEWGMIIFMVLAGLGSVWAIRRGQRAKADGR